MVDKWIIVVFGVSFGVWCGADGQTCTECGSSCCKASETCELSVNNGTCYKTADQINCGLLYYCYEPMTCCGTRTCCPGGSTCTFDYICVDQRTPSSASSYTYRSSSGSGWYIVGFTLLCIKLIIVFVAICSRRRSRAHHGQVIVRPRAGATVATANIPLGTTYAIRNAAPTPVTNYQHTPYTMPQNKAQSLDYEPNNTSSQLNVDANVGSVHYAAASGIAASEPRLTIMSEGSAGRPGVHGSNVAEHSSL